MVNKDGIFLRKSYGLVCTQNLYPFNLISKERDAVPSSCRQNAGGKMKLYGSVQYLQFQQPHFLQVQCRHFSSEHNLQWSRFWMWGTRLWSTIHWSPSWSFGELLKESKQNCLCRIALNCSPRHGHYWTIPGASVLHKKYTKIITDVIKMLWCWTPIALKHIERWQFIISGFMTMLLW